MPAQASAFERRLPWISAISSLAAIVMFTLNKWEVERRLQALSPAEQEAWRNGTYRTQQPPPQQQPPPPQSS